MGKHQVVVAAATRPAEVLPTDIADFIGKPSLLETEVAADYDALLHRFAETVKPKDAIEWIWVADVTHLVWEMRRLRGLRTVIIERRTARALDDLVREILGADYDWDERHFMEERLELHWKSADPYRRQIVQRFLMRKGVDLRQVHALVSSRCLEEFSELESLIANLGRRRDSVLREIERRRDTVARRLRDVTDAEFEITKPGTQPVGN